MTHVPIRKAVDALIRTSLFPVHAGIAFPETDLHPEPGRRFRTIRLRQTALPELQAKGEQNFCSVRRPGGSTPAAFSTNGTWPDSGPAVIKQFF